MRIRRGTGATELQQAPGRRMSRWGGAVLALAGAGGAYVSWGSIYAAVSTSDIGQHSPVLVVNAVSVNVVAAVVAGLIDLWILGASLKYIANVRAGRPAGTWRMGAQVGIAATFAANVASASSWGDAGWHVIAPAVWSAAVEFTARDVLGDMREIRTHRAEVIPFRLWVTAPVESARTTFRMLRTGQTTAVDVRLDADRRRAAADALRLELEDVETSRVKRWRVRRLAGRRLWAGTITPDDVFRAIGWDGVDGPARGSTDILRAVLSAVRGAESIRPITPGDAIGSWIGSGIEPIGSTGSANVLALGLEREPIEGAGIGSVVPIGAAQDRRVLADRGRGADRATSLVARDGDVARVRAAIVAGELAWPLVVEHVRVRLGIAPKYARAAAQQVTAEGDPRERQRQEVAEAEGDKQAQEVPEGQQEEVIDVRTREETEAQMVQEVTSR